MSDENQITEERKLLETGTYLYVTFIDNSTFEGYFKHSTEKYLILELNISVKVGVQDIYIPFVNIRYFSTKSRELEEE